MIFFRCFVTEMISVCVFVIDQGRGGMVQTVTNVYGKMCIDR